MESPNEITPLPPVRVDTDLSLNRPYTVQDNLGPQQYYPQQPMPQTSGPQQYYPQQPMPQTSGYQQPQTIYTQSMPSDLRSYQHYKGKLSVKLGVINIFLVTISIILNSVGFHLYIRGYNWFGDFVLIWCPAAFCVIFVYLAASFAIVAGLIRTRSLIITHLALAIYGSCSAFIFMAISMTVLAYEVSAIKYITISLDKGSFAIVILCAWILMSGAIFIITTWGAVLCCQVLCCGTIDDTGGAVTMVTRGTVEGDAVPVTVMAQQVQPPSTDDHRV